MWKDTTMMMSFISIKKKINDTSLSFTISNGVGLIELATRDVELTEEKLGPSKKCLQKSEQPAKK
jgi:hypothetical protein